VISTAAATLAAAFDGAAGESSIDARDEQRDADQDDEVEDVPRFCGEMECRAFREHSEQEHEDEGAASVVSRLLLAGS
jgi:hypothetical protein